MNKLRQLIPTIIRVIGILGIFASLIVLLVSFFPDKTVSENVMIPGTFESQTVVQTIPNPYTWQLALGMAIASIITFGFAALVQAAEYYISSCQYYAQESEQSDSEE